jgi:hypothetical protein
VESFARGQGVTPGRGSNLVNGPANVARPTSTSWAGTKAISPRADTTGILNRDVYRSGSNSYSGNSSFRAGASRSSMSASEAANQARESIRSSYAGRVGYSGSTRGFYGTNGSSGQSRPGFNSRSGELGGNSRPESGFSGSSNRGWSVPDHGGWSHVHTDSRPGGGISSGSTHSGGGGFSGGSHAGGPSGGGRGH